MDVTNHPSRNDHCGIVLFAYCVFFSRLNVYIVDAILATMTNSTDKAAGGKGVNAFPAIAFFITLGLAVVIKMGWI